MMGLATLLSGARLCMNTDTAYLCCLLADDSRPYVSSRLNTKYGLQQNTNASSHTHTHHNVGNYIAVSGANDVLLLLFFIILYYAERQHKNHSSKDKKYKKLRQ